MRKRLHVVLAALVVMGPMVGREAGAVAGTVTENLKRHVYYLASDSLAGRLVGTAGIEEAGRYIAAEFQSIGLAPAFDGSYFQEFDIDLGFELHRPAVLRMGDVLLQYGKDFDVLPCSGSSSVEGSTGMLPAERLARNDRVLVVLIDAGRDDERWTMTGKDGLLEWMRSAGVKAAEKGAAAAIFVGEPGRPDAPLHRFPTSRAYSPLDIPALEITYRAFERACASQGIDPAGVAVVEMSGMKSLDVAPGLRCNLDVAVGPGHARVRNVGGLLRGSAGGFIVVGAHYDHLGLGDIASSTPWRREVHRGADDNASGVAGVIEIARMLVSRGRPERSIVFLAFTAEEEGALGSEYYCKNPPYPMDSTVAMINLDCIGRLENSKLIAFGARSAEELGGLLEEAVDGHDLDLVEKKEIYGFSDQNPFYARGIPSLHFFTGANTDYHSPDDVPAKINFDGLADVVAFVTDFAEDLALGSTMLTPVVIAPETRPAVSPGGGAHLGIVPDFAYSGTGVGIKGAVPDSPAEEAGLMQGDVLVGIDGEPLADLRGLMVFLSGKSPGDTISIHLMRGPASQYVRAVLGVRSSQGHGD
jgi:aminopeptidase YwaD